MLVLKRKRHESILIGSDIRVTIVEVAGGGVRVGIEAPRGVQVDREEVRRGRRNRSQVEAIAS